MVDEYIYVFVYVLNGKYLMKFRSSGDFLRDNMKVKFLLKLLNDVNLALFSPLNYQTLHSSVGKTPQR